MVKKMQKHYIHVSETEVSFFSIYFWFKYNLGQKYYAPQVRPDQRSNS